MQSADVLLAFCAKRPLKIAGRTSTKVNNPGNRKEKGGDLHGGSDMRLACPRERLDCLPIGQVKLNWNCRDEIIPILCALQHLYEDDALRSEILRLVGKDVNHGASRKRGRRGLSYWEIVVLAAANGLEGWRQHEHWLRKAKKIVHGIGRVSRAKGLGADRLKPGYQKLLALAAAVLTRARRLLGALTFVMPETGLTLEKLRQT